MKILVTGGTGFLGRHLVWRLAAEGVDVVFTGRRLSAANKVCELSPWPVQWQPIEHGTTEAAETLAACAKDAYAVVHCAALSSPWGRRKEFRRANVDSTREVLHACSKANVTRLIHISTPSVYFNFQDRIGICEDETLPSPANEYARSKAEAEKLVQKESVSETVILRPRALFGPWDETLMPRMLRVMKRGPIPLMRGGNALLDLTYIDNVVDAIWLALIQPLQQRITTYNVSNGEGIELKTLLEKVASAFKLPLRTQTLPWPLVNGAACFLEAAARLHGSEPPLTRYSAGVLAFSQTLDISAIQRGLGYEARISLDEGIHHHAQWWLSQEKGMTL